MRKQSSGLKVSEFATRLGIGESTVWRWIRSGLIFYEEFRIPLQFAKKIERLWKKTCSPIEVARELNVSPSKIDKMLNDGCFRTTTITRKIRIFRNSISRAKKYIVIKQEDVLYPRRKGFARLSKSKRTEISSLGGRRIRPSNIASPFRALE